MEVAALTIAILSITIAMLALGWQIATWALDGPRLQAVLLQGVMGHGGPAVAAVGRDRKPRDFSSMRAQGWDGPEVLGVVVTNRGRLRAKVTRFGIHLKRGSLSVQYPESNPWSPNLPYWLEPGESETWYFDIRDARALVETTRQSLYSAAGGVYMTAETGTGKTLRTRRHLEF